MMILLIHFHKCLPVRKMYLDIIFFAHSRIKNNQFQNVASLLWNLSKWSLGAHLFAGQISDWEKIIKQKGYSRLTIHLCYCHQLQMADRKGWSRSEGGLGEHLHL